MQQHLKDFAIEGRKRRAGIASLVLAATFIAFANPSFGQPAIAGRSSDGIWTRLDARSLPAARTEAPRPRTFAAFALDQDGMKALLARAPFERTAAAGEAPFELLLPMPDGSFERFRLEEYSMMEPGLAAQYPEIRTYSGQGLDDPTATAKFDWTLFGFHGYVLSQKGTVYVDPLVKGDTSTYISFFKRDVAPPSGGYLCMVGGNDSPLADASTEVVPGIDDRIFLPVSSGTTLHTYRLALAATVEYTAAKGGTVPGALSAMTTTMNRVNGIYERDVAVRMTLIGSESSIIFTSEPDGYTNSNGNTMLGENQTKLDAVIGTANYDIGHVFSTGGGGVASLGVPCDNGQKARGVTGLPDPDGDKFDVDFVAHEMGHQFGARHTFNGTIGACGFGNRNAAAAYEPASGSTIMAYAGICSASGPTYQDLQLNSNDYFHVKSLEEIVAEVASNSCDVESATGNTLPTVNGGADITIPKGTPFSLIASGSDANGDTITYNWEEYDLGPASPPDNDSGGTARPIFRSYPSKTTGTRIFPDLTYIRNNANLAPATYTNASPTGIPNIACTGYTCVTGDVLPSIARTMVFQVTARDNRANGGGIATDSVTVNVASSGPFQVTSPNTAVSWTGGSPQTVTWNVNGTTGAPVSAANVSIRESTDGGLTFPKLIVASTPNDGSQSIDIPNLTTATARIRVQPVGNLFFDISDTNFSTSLDTDLIGQDGVECDCFDNWTTVSGRPNGIAAGSGSANVVVGDISTTTAAAMNGTYGIRAQVNGVESAYVQDDAASDEGRVRVRFMFDPNSMDTGEAQNHHRIRLMLGLDMNPSTKRAFAVVLRRQSGAYAVSVRVLNDGGGRYDSGFFTVSDAPHTLVLDWKRATSAGANNGSIALSIDGSDTTLPAGFNTIDNDTFGIDSIRMGLTSVKGGASGALFFDRYEARKQNPPSP